MWRPDPSVKGETIPSNFNWVRNSTFGILSASFVVAGFLFFHHTAIIGLVRQWGGNSTYSFGFIIPLFSGYLIWIRRERLSQMRISPSPAIGFAILIASGFLSVAGVAGGILILQEVALLLAVPALILVFFGKGILSAIKFPIAYLILMLPAWDPVIERFQYPGQLFSAKMAMKLLDVIGVPAFQQGIYIEIPGMTIEVSKACSGVNFLISTIAVGIPMAVLFFDSWWKRILLLLVSLLVAVLGNSLRVALIVLFAYKGYSTNIHGPYHMFYGYFVSVLGLMVLFAGVFLFGKRPVPVEANPAKAVTDPKEHSSTEGKRWPLVVVTMVVFLAGGWYSHYRPVKPIGLKNDLHLFPGVIGEYSSVETTMRSNNFPLDGADATISRVYRDRKGKEYQLRIGYYSYQKQGKLLADYRAREIFRRSKAYPLGQGSHPEGNINAFVEGKTGKQHLVLYWYRLGNKSFFDPVRIRFQTVVNSLLTGRTDGSIVVVQTEYDGRSDIPSQIKEHSGFFLEIIPLAEKFLDTW